MITSATIHHCNDDTRSRTYSLLRPWFSKLRGTLWPLTLASIQLVVSCSFSVRANKYTFDPSSRALTLYAVVVYTSEPLRSMDRTTPVFSKDAHEGKAKPSTTVERCSQHQCNTMIVNVECDRSGRVTSATVITCRYQLRNTLSRQRNV